MLAQTGMHPGPDVGGALNAVGQTPYPPELRNSNPVKVRWLATPQVTDSPVAGQRLCAKAGKSRSGEVAIRLAGSAVVQRRMTLDRSSGRTG